MTDGPPKIVRRVVHQDGRRLSYQIAGPIDGPVVLLLHGLLSDSTTWQPAIGALAQRGMRVIALDQLGHGQSDKPPLRYSLDDFASSISAFLTTLGTGPVTVAGHSLGGAIAMQFAHSYPAQTARLVLVSSGGLGKQVHLILRWATLPGVSSLLRLTVNSRTARLYRAPKLHRALRLGPEAVNNLSRMGRSLVSGEGRSAFISAVRAAIRPTGQRGNMIELDYVAKLIPTLIVWSIDDPIIPVSHAHATHAHLPNSQLALFEGTSHQPHHREPERFAQAVAAFIDETDSAVAR
jgi:pimeloyl-ACP methyl ester carboxylesterase